MNDLSGGQYSVNKNIGFKTRMLRSDLCDYIDAHILIKGTIIIKSILNADTRNEKLTFKNKAPFRSCISKILNIFVDNTDDLEIFMQCIICQNIVAIVL